MNKLKFDNRYLAIAIDLIDADDKYKNISKYMYEIFNFNGKEGELYDYFR